MFSDDVAVSDLHVLFTRFAYQGGCGGFCLEKGCYVSISLGNIFSSFMEQSFKVLSLFILVKPHVESLCVYSPSSPKLSLFKIMWLEGRHRDPIFMITNDGYDCYCCSGLCCSLNSVGNYGYFILYFLSLECLTSTKVCT